MNNSALWQLGGVVLHETIAATLLSLVGYGIVVTLLRALDAASRHAKRAIRLHQTEPGMVNSTAAPAQELPLVTP